MFCARWAGGLDGGAALVDDGRGRGQPGRNSVTTASPVRRTPEAGAKPPVVVCRAGILCIPFQRKRKHRPLRPLRPHFGTHAARLNAGKQRRTCKTPHFALTHEAHRLGERGDLPRQGLRPPCVQTVQRWPVSTPPAGRVEPSSLAVRQFVATNPIGARADGRCPAVTRKNFFGAGSLRSGLLAAAMLHCWRRWPLETPSTMVADVVSGELRRDGRKSDGGIQPFAVGRGLRVRHAYRSRYQTPRVRRLRRRQPIVRQGSIIRLKIASRWWCRIVSRGKQSLMTTCSSTGYLAPRRIWRLA